jgi:uncharacterized flavoprotein (TIGR03862 family)
MAAEVISAAGVPVDVYDAMPSAGRKLLRAGIGGLNLTHAEPAANFLGRYGDHRHIVARWLTDFGPQALRDWAQGLGVATFVGSSGRVFPTDMKAAPLLRAWLQRLREQGVRFHLRHRWLGWTEEGALRFATPDGTAKVCSGGTATVLALGGGSWARLGSDGAWIPLLTVHGIDIAPLRPANCGFTCAWSEHLRSRFAGQPVKGVTASFGTVQQQGEFIVTRHGVEGGLIYALSAPLRDAIEQHGLATLNIDLLPGRALARLTADLQQPRGRDSLANHLRRRAGIAGIKAALLREVASPAQLNDPVQLAELLKALPLRLIAPRPIDEAISTAGGVRFAELTDTLMLKQLPGTFCAGEMLDWEAPTGGYLLTACLASGRIAGNGVLNYLCAAGPVSR